MNYSFCSLDEKLLPEFVFHYSYHKIDTDQEMTAVMFSLTALRTKQMQIDVCFKSKTFHLK